MGFFEPAPPPFDLEEWRAKPHLSRLKPLVQDWGGNGFGSPTFVTHGEVFWGDDRLEDAITWHTRRSELLPVR